MTIGTLGVRYIGAASPFALGPAALQQPSVDAGFQQMLLKSLDATNVMEQQADAAITQSLIAGDMTQIEVLSAVKKADLSLRLMLQIRNKILDAYQEIQQMRM